MAATEQVPGTPPGFPVVPRRPKDVAEMDFFDLEAIVAQARRHRTDALGDYLVSGWHALAGAIRPLRSLPRRTARQLKVRQRASW